MAKTKSVTKKITPKIKSYPKITNAGQLQRLTTDESLKPKSVKVGKLEGEYWVWPSGTKTHLRHINMGVRKYQSLPRGFYAAVEKSDLRNLKLLVVKAKGIGLKDDRDE